MEDAENEWDNVQEVVPTFRQSGTAALPQGGQGLVAEKPLITWQSALAHMKERVRTIPSATEILSRQYGRRRYKVLCCCWSRPSLHLLEEMKVATALTQCPFDDGDPVHFQVLLTVYKQLTGDRLDCPRYGSHWEQIGFQGNDPSTDLRGMGLLGLLQPLFLVTSPELMPFVQKVYKLSLDETQNFPLMVLLINLTRIAFDAFIDGRLNRSLSAEVGDVWFGFNFFFSAVLYQYYKSWKGGHKTIKDSGYVLKDVENFSRTHPSAVIKELQEHLKTYSIQEKQIARENFNRRTASDTT